MNKDAVKDFSNDWYEKGDEKSDTQKFWLTLLRDVFEIAKPEKVIDFEQPVKIDAQTKFIDGYIAATKVLIEQKSFGVDLSKKILQSDGTELTPFEQAQRYAEALPAEKKPRWIILCNFSEFKIYKQNRTEPTIIKLRDLRWQFPRLKFLIDAAADDAPPEEKISKDAAKIVQQICFAFDKKYLKREPAFLDSLSKLCTRLVFCFYADDAQIFTKEKFGDYLKALKSFSPEQLRDALQKFFAVLNTPETQRPETLDDALKNFPYVNGGLFDEKISIPPINKDLKFAIERAHILKLGFDENIKFSWREIDPPIFGAIFESIFNPATQHDGGMYYTSSDNIHKVIDPLFLDDLRDEFNKIKKKHKNKVQFLKNFQDKIASLNFLDPACGSGNFLTETYISLRRLENEILEELRNLFAELPDNPVKVSVRQFYGIEIDPFAVAVAQTALWIAELQMIQETEGALGKNLRILPLTKYVTIKRANALQIDWKDFAPDVDYIIGNPPFLGKSFRSPAQKTDMKKVFAGVKNHGNLDYVACWYKKAADFMAGNKTRSALVATNSICQGIAVPPLWKNLFAAGIHIDFAYRTFKWLSDSDNMAQVHCVVIGFSTAPNDKPKIIFDGDKIFPAQNINAYLVDAPNIIVEPRDMPLNKDAPLMIVGSCPADGGGFIIETDDYEPFIKDEPAAKNWIRRYMGSNEFINNIKRYCLWLKDCPSDEIKKMPLVSARVEAVKNFRLASKKIPTQRRAKTPTLFTEDRFVDAPALFIPMVSGNRRYVPIGFIDAGIVANNKSFFIPNGDRYTFGILTSSIHMAWMRVVAAYLGTSYSYSATMVYNTFPWCSPSAEQKILIEESAQKILDVRKKYSDWTYAKLYDEETMPAALRLAHKSNDYAVALAYGFEKILEDEAKVVAELMKLYQSLK